MKTPEYCDKVETIKEFENFIDLKRKEYKNSWFIGTFTINNVNLSIKSYNTWVQRIQVNDGPWDSSNMDIKVKDFKIFIHDFLTSQILKGEY